MSAHAHLRAVETEPVDLTERVAALESELTEERTTRRKAEAAANEMAILVASVRTELAEERDAHRATEATAAEMAALVAREHARARKAEDELRLAWAQVPMAEQRELSPVKRPFGRRARRALRGR